MLNINGVKSADARAWDSALSSKMNYYYHLRIRSRWGKFDLLSKIVIALIAGLGAISAAGAGPKWLAWASLTSSVLGLLVVAIRVDRKLDVHTSLATRYLAHFQDFERLLEKGDLTDLERLTEAYNQTERFESEQEGEADYKLLQEFQSKVLTEIGASPQDVPQLSAI